MSVASIDAGMSGDRASFDGPDVFSEPWPATDDRRRDDDPVTLVEGSNAGVLIAESKSGLPQACTEQQIAEWIDAVVGRDERALAALYDATCRRVFGMVQRIARNTAMTEEVVEDTYFQVWRQAARFDPNRGNAITWLLSIARSRAIDALRREARLRHEYLDQDAGLDLASEERPSDELLDMARRHADLHKALMLIGAERRQLVSLAFFRGLTHEEIAKQTQMPLGTVKARLRRTMLALRRILAEGDQAASEP